MNGELSENERNYNQAVEDLRTKYFGETVDEGTVAADSLKTYPSHNKSTTTANADKRASNKDYLQASLDNAATRDGVKDGTAKRNRSSLSTNASKNANSLRDVTNKAKDNLDQSNRRSKRDERYETPPKTMGSPAQKKEIEKLMSIHFGPEFTTQATELFWSAVESRAENVSICNKLLELFDASPELKLIFADDSQLDYVTELANYLKALETEIARLELESEWLLAHSALHEEVVFEPPTKPHRTRRSLSAEDLSEVNPESLLMETPKHQYMNDPMAKRVQYLNQTARVDPTAASNLMETWDITKSN